MPDFHSEPYIYLAGVSRTWWSNTALLAIAHQGQRGTSGKYCLLNQGKQATATVAWPASWLARERPARSTSARNDPAKTSRS